MDANSVSTSPASDATASSAFAVVIHPTPLTPSELRTCKKYKNDWRVKHRDVMVSDDQLRCQPFQLQARGTLGTHPSLDTRFKIEPAEEWYSMNRYQQFKMNNNEFRTGSFIWVANEETFLLDHKDAAEAKSNKKTKINPREYGWVGMVLEIRAQDENNVFLRLAWMYWPDDLPECRLVGGGIVKGRQPYYGRCEMIGSNHMDIINASTVSALASVTHWTERDGELHTSLYWRQILDVRTFELTQAEPICVCHRPENPDALVIGCPQDECLVWNHGECIIDAILSMIFARLGAKTPRWDQDPPLAPEDVPLPPQSRSASAGRRPKKTAFAVKPWRKFFSGRLVRIQSAQSKEVNTTPLVEVCDLRGLSEGVRVWTEPIFCLVCRSKVE